MLLAAAATMLHYLVDWRLVEFYGVDIGATCVAMAKLNCRLYGLNGADYIVEPRELSPQILTQIPEPFGPLYAEANAAQDETQRATVVEKSRLSVCNNFRCSIWKET